MTTLKKLMQYHNLTDQEMHEFTKMMFDETVEPSIKVGHLIALKMKSETAEELTALAKSLIASTYDEMPTLQDSICVCGTGGDFSESFNISTTASFVVAASGLKVVKHGNRSITSKTGSIDILGALGVETTPLQDSMSRVNETNLAFLSAMETYPLMKHIQPIRKMIPMPTIFNLVGPLINPYALDYQVMGVYDAAKLELVAETVKNLGRKRAIILTGAGGMDEATLSGDNQIYEVNETGINSYTLNATDLGLDYAPNEALKGGDPEQNKHITLSILKNIDKGPKRDVVILNAALALYISGKAGSIEAGVDSARKLIESGAAYRVLEQVGGKIYDCAG